MTDHLEGTENVQTGTIITGTRKDPVGLLHLTRGTDMIDAIVTVTMTVARTDLDLARAEMNHGMNMFACVELFRWYLTSVCLQLRPLRS